MTKSSAGNSEGKMERASGAPFVHPTAVVDDGAVIGAETRIWHFSHVMGTARVGERCVLGQNVFIGTRSTVGDGCKLQNNVSIYEGVELDDDVFCGPSAVFTNVRRPRAHIEQKDAFQATRVGRGATIGANATIVCGTTLGPYSFIGAGAVVTHDVPAYGSVLGAPARLRGWVCQCGGALPFEVDGAVGQEGACARCGDRYRRTAEGVEPA